MADEQVAATLAAALIQLRETGKDTTGPAAAKLAVQVFLDCLDALKEAEKSRSVTKREPLNL